MDFREALSLIGRDFSRKVLRPEDIIGLKIQALSNDETRAFKEYFDKESLPGLYKNNLDWSLLEEYFTLFDTFGGVQTPPFGAGKGYAALSINPEQTTVFRPWCRRIDLGHKYQEYKNKYYAERAR